MNEEWTPVKLPRSFSFSAASTWTDCPRRYWEQKILGKNSTSIEAVRGTLMHAAAEELAKLDPEERSEERLIQFADEALRQYKEEGGEFYGPGLARAVKERCRTLWRLENWKVIPGTHVELRLEGTSPNGRPILGYADRVDEHNGELIATDLKSGKSGPWSKAPAARQGGLYTYLMQQMGHNAQLTRFVYCGSGTGLNNIVLIKHNEESLAEVMNWFDGACDGIEDAINKANAQQTTDPDQLEIPQNTSPLCNYCPAGPKGDKTCQQ